jgi:hypothetical protein
MNKQITKVLIALAVVIPASVALGQSSSPQVDDKSKQPKPPSHAAEKAIYSTDDCRRDMVNAQEAKQSGHITEKEVAEQKKMSQTKLKRDSGKAATGTEKPAGCS